MQFRDNANITLNYNESNLHKLHSSVLEKNELEKNEQLFVSSLNDEDFNYIKNTFEKLFEQFNSKFNFFSQVITEFHTNGYKDEFLLILSLLSIALGILVIISKNPIISVLFLIGLFMSISFYLMFLGLNFLAISYLLVYIGAVSILFLFILMLINVRVSELLSDTYNSIVLSILITLYFGITISQIIPDNLSGTSYISEYTVNKLKNNYLNRTEILKLSEETSPVSYVSFESWDNNLTSISHITSIGNVLYTNYSIWLILTSIILLLAMVGCIIITIKQK